LKSYGSGASGGGIFKGRPQYSSISAIMQNASSRN